MYTCVLVCFPLVLSMYVGLSFGTPMCGPYTYHHIVEQRWVAQVPLVWAVAGVCNQWYHLQSFGICSHPIIFRASWSSSFQWLMGATMEPWKSGELLVWMSLVLTPLLHHTSLSPQIGQESQVEKKTLKCGDIFKKAFLLFSSPGFETTGVLGPQVSVPEGSHALEISAPTSIYHDVSLWLYKWGTVPLYRGHYRGHFKWS